jgi:hypothetical protein
MRTPAFAAGASPFLGNCGIALPRIRSVVMHEVVGSPRWIGRGPVENIAAKRERLGTALHELAMDLATERRRNADLERENRRLRRMLEASGVTA